MVNRNKFLWENEIIIKTWTLLVKKVYIKKKGRVYEISDKRKTEIMDFWK